MQSVRHEEAQTFLRQWLIVGLALSVAGVGCWSRRWMSDDGAITLRLVDQLKAGNGPVFNAGERVEAATSALWLALLTVADLMTPLRLEWISVAGGISLTIAGLALACAGAAQLRAGPPPLLWVPVGLVFLGLLPLTWDWSSAGMEGGLIFAWLGGCLLGLARLATKPSGGRRLPLSVLVGLGPLVRPDFAIYTASFGLTLLFWSAGWRTRLTRFVAAAALPVVYQIFRMGYFAMLVPNTGIAKEASVPWWEQGWNYLGSFLIETWIVPAVAVVACALLLAARATGPRSRSTVLSAVFALSAMAHALYVVRIGGDWMFGRMFLPPLYALFAPVAVIPWTKAFRGVRVLAVLTVITVIPVALSGPYRGNYRVVDVRRIQNPQGEVTSDEWTWSNTPSWGRDLKRTAAAGDGRWVVYPSPYHLPMATIDVPAPRGQVTGSISGIGFAGYVAGVDVHIDDTLGLANALGSHIPTAEREDSRLSPGHEKQLPLTWSAARFLRSTDPVPPALDAPSVAAARKALSCPMLVELRSATSSKLTVRRFFTNIARSPRLTQMRFPADPFKAATCRW